MISDPLEETFVPDHGEIARARSDPSITSTREQIVRAIESVTMRWWTDAETTAVRNKVFLFSGYNYQREVLIFVE